MDLQIPILRIPYPEDERAYIHRGLDDIMTSGQLTLAKYTQQFEEEFAAFTGSRFAVATTNCTSALELILRALDIRNASVIVPTNTFLASGFAVVHSGNRIIFADSEPETMCLDVTDVERRIAPDTKAVMLVHIGGIITPAVHRLEQLCERRGLYLIEDCAHAHGSSISGRQAGTLGVAGAFSFFPTKVLTTGEGGMITTDDEGIARSARMIRNQGKNPELQHHISEIGHNYRMSELTALLGVAQMKKAAALIQERQSIAAMYDKALVSVCGVDPLRLAKDVCSSYYKYVAYLDEPIDRKSLKAVLRDQYGVCLTGEVYEDLCHAEPVWQRFTHCGRPKGAEDGRGCAAWPSCDCATRSPAFPGAEHLSRHHICLPLYPGLNQREVSYVVESLAGAICQLRAE